jgi:hypothetical protein
VFDESATTSEIFERAVKGLVRSVVDGYNGTVFAYGQTAAGKTHTMLGAWLAAMREVLEAHAPPRAAAISSLCA